MLDHKLLPAEIWFEIFECATYSPTSCKPEWTPFEDMPEAKLNPNLRTLVTLSEVCRIWHYWVAPLLLRDIEIMRGPRALLEVLKKPSGPLSAGRQYGDMVRRVIMPFGSTIPAWGAAAGSVEILRLCRHIHTLLRPYDATLNGIAFDREVTGIALPSLQRIEWSLNGAADRSGGINSLSAVLRNAPQVRYLFIGDDAKSGSMNISPNVLPALQTLRLHVTSGPILTQIMLKWSLPSLRRIIVDFSPFSDGLADLWKKFGSNLEVAELGQHLRFMKGGDIFNCLKGCPNLKELDYHIFYTRAPTRIPYHEHLTTVRLHAAANYLQGDGNGFWENVNYHFDFLCSSSLVALQTIVLHGDWKATLEHPAFQKVQRKVRMKGKALVLATQTDEGVGLSRIV